MAWYCGWGCGYSLSQCRSVAAVLWAVEERWARYWFQWVICALSIFEIDIYLIDWVFLSIDTLGGLFSLFALGTINPSLRTLNKMLMWTQRPKAHLISWEGLCISWCKFSLNLFFPFNTKKPTGLFSRRGYISATSSGAFDIASCAKRQKLQGWALMNYFP
jgi:hypothetical protein